MINFLSGVLFLLVILQDSFIVMPYTMKRYILSAEFIKWKLDDPESQKDTMNYVVELVSDEEAKTRLESLIIERMSSKPGWTFELVNSSFAEFSDESSSSTLPEDLKSEAADEVPFIPDLITPIQPGEEIPVNTPDPGQEILPDQEKSEDTIDPDQIQS